MIASPRTRAPSQVVGAILAGGLARRLGGAAKGLLLVDGTSVIERVASAMRPLTSRTVIVSSNAAASTWLPDAEVVPDERPGAGALAAVAAALRSARADVLVVAWDMPFVTSALLAPLISTDAASDATMWETPSGIEPLCACYRQSALTILDRAIADGMARARDVASVLRVQMLRELPTGTDPHAFLSINTPEDLARALCLAHDRRQAPASRT